MQSMYSYLPNIRGGPNKRGGWKNLEMGRVGQISLQGKKVCRGWKIFLESINGVVKGGHPFRF